MKPALSLTLILTFVTSARPVMAQERVTSLEPPGPLARAMTHEAVRLAAAGESTASSADAVQEGDKPVADSNWSRVRKLAPGTEITVLVKGYLPRYFVAGDESTLTVLNVTDPTLPRAARDVLRDVVSKHPEDFRAAQQHETFVMPKNVRVGPDGVFVADRKVADLGQVIENIARTDIAEIRRGLGFRSPSWRERARVTAGGVLGGVAGFFAGGLIGFVIDEGLNPCKPHTGDCYAGLGGALIGSVAGAVLGDLVGERAARVDDGVIYRAR